MLGYLAASRKSALLRWPSRCSSPVERPLTGIVASTVESAGSASFSSRTPRTPWKLPFTLEIIMCRTLNEAVEWAGSTFQVEMVLTVAVAADMGFSSFPALDAAARYSLQQL